MIGELSVGGPSAGERNWAMLAHLTALSTLVIAMSTAGLGHVVGLLVPLAYSVSKAQQVSLG